MEGLKQYNGLYFDPATGKTYREDGSDTGFTFERATWTGPFGLHFQWPWLNPIAFATHGTAEKVLGFAKKAAPAVAMELDESDRVVGPFTRTPERVILVSEDGNEERFSAGWLAHSIIFRGEPLAAQSFRAELKQARFAV